MIQLDVTKCPCGHRACRSYVVTMAGVPQTGPIAEATARLMAAAPDLLEVLRKLVQSIYDLEVQLSFHDAIQNAEAAIAKATGGEQS